MKYMQRAHTVIVVLLVGLMSMPFGVNCYYASSSRVGDVDFSTVHSLSFFDVRLFDFQNPLPFFTAIFSVLLLGISLWRAIKPVPWMDRVSAVMSGVGFLMAMLPLFLYGVEYFSTSAMTAAFLFVCAAVVDIYILKGVLLYTPKTEE